MNRELTAQKSISNPNLFDRFKHKARDFENYTLTNLIMKYDRF